MANVKFVAEYSHIERVNGTNKKKVNNQIEINELTFIELGINVKWSQIVFMVEKEGEVTYKNPFDLPGEESLITIKRA